MLTGPEEEDILSSKECRKRIEILHVLALMLFKSSSFPGVAQGSAAEHSQAHSAEAIENRTAILCLNHIRVSWRDPYR